MLNLLSENKKDSAFTVGLLMILIGAVSLLELNGKLPKSFLQEIVNIGIGSMFVVMYLKKRKFYLVMLGTFFLTNGGVHLIDALLIGYNYWTSIFIIPGVMLIVTYCIQKRMPSYPRK